MDLRRLTTSWRWSTRAFHHRRPGRVGVPARPVPGRQGARTELGTVLFERLGRRVGLTSRRGAHGPAQKALRDVETGRAAVAAVTGLPAGSLALASLPTLAADPMAGIVGRFRRRHPGVAVDLAAPEDTAELVDLVRDGQCELGIGEETGLPTDLRTVPVEVNDCWSSCRRGHPGRRERFSGLSRAGAS